MRRLLILALLASGCPEVSEPAGVVRVRTLTYRVVYDNPEEGTINLGQPVQTGDTGWRRAP